MGGGGRVYNPDLLTRDEAYEWLDGMVRKCVIEPRWQGDRNFPLPWERSLRAVLFPFYCLDNEREERNRGGTMRRKYTIFTPRKNETWLSVDDQTSSKKYVLGFSDLSVLCNGCDVTSAQLLPISDQNTLHWLVPYKSS